MTHDVDYTTGDYAGPEPLTPTDCRECGNSLSYEETLHSGRFEGWCGLCKAFVEGQEENE